MPWFRKSKKPKPVQRSRERSPIPEGIWSKCEGCKEAIYTKDLQQNLQVCPKCGFHFRVSARARMDQLLDEEAEKEELFADISPRDPLDFVDTESYRERLERYQEKLGERDAVVVFEGSLDGIDVVLAALEYRFMGGSMGSVVGEKLTRAIEAAVARRVPFIAVSASGGARMQEGVLSLMQMAKISAALNRLRNGKLPYLSVLTDPTTGGVTASFAMLGDINIAEPGALIGFAGPRVIEQTIGQELPEGFQRSEFLLEHGFVDMVVPRGELKSTLASCLRHLGA